MKNGKRRIVAAILFLELMAATAWADTPSAMQEVVDRGDLYITGAVYLAVLAASLGFSWVFSRLIIFLLRDVGKRD